MSYDKKFFYLFIFSDNEQILALCFTNKKQLKRKPAEKV